MQVRVLGAVLAIPLAGLVVLLVAPSLDVRWEHQPSHFWLVLVAAALNAVLAFATGEAATRRGDTRTFLVSMALVISAGFLALHALATPGVVLDGPNAGFTIATPVGLVLASLLAAASIHPRFDTAPLSRPAQRVIRAVVLAILVGWAAASLAHLPLLEEPVEAEVPAFLRVLAPVAIALYAFAAVRYAALSRQRRRVLPLAIAVGWLLLGEAMVAIVFSRTWHLTWWEWHLLMALAFAAIFVSARAEYRREGSVSEAFASLYQEQTLALWDRQSAVALGELARALQSEEPLDQVRARLRADGLTGERIAALEHSARELRRVDDLLHSYVGGQLADRLAEEPDLAGLGGHEVEVTVLFADLVGFTSFSESRPPEDGMALLNTYWSAVVPAIVDQFGGFIERFAGDGILVIFNSLGDQPDHALRAVQSAVFVQEAIQAIADRHEGWPLFRIGINTGRAVVGNVGADQRRNFTVIGDTANTAARFEALATPGRILIGESTWSLVHDDVEAVSLGSRELKGKAQPQQVYEVRSARTRPSSASS